MYLSSLLEVLHSIHRRNLHLGERRRERINSCECCSCKHYALTLHVVVVVALVFAGVDTLERNTQLGGKTQRQSGTIDFGTVRLLFSFCATLGLLCQSQQKDVGADMMRMMKLVRSKKLPTFSE